MMLINPFMVASSSAVTQILMPLTTADGFVDIKNNHAITVVGSPTISTVQSKFGAGALLVSSGNYLRINSTSTLDMSGKKPFTFECWVYITAGEGGILSMRTTAVYCPIAFIRSHVRVGNSSLTNWLGAGITVPRDQWVHCAIVGDGTNIKQYQNGVMSGTAAVHQSWPTGNRFLNIGYDPDAVTAAYINDVRVSSGVVYSGNFTPPSSPFTA